MLFIILRRLGAFAFAQKRTLSTSITYRFGTVFGQYGILTHPAHTCIPDVRDRFAGSHLISFTYHRYHQTAIEATRFHSTHSRVARQRQTGSCLSCPAVRLMRHSVTTFSQRSTCLQAPQREILSSGYWPSRFRLASWPGPAYSHLGGHTRSAAKEPNRPF